MPLQAFTVPLDILTTSPSLSLKSFHAVNCTLPELMRVVRILSVIALVSMCSSVLLPTPLTRTTGRLPS